ncbi:hypothetical protein [Streptomyces sp. NPDC014894]|uniref:hypothetical protein n=1 Tax=Streptomyces sp. NPDC014894 TaxID=3364931 RepID=UPI0036F59966
MAKVEAVRGRWSPLLLLALLFGLAGMHTLGHPAAHGSPAASEPRIAAVALEHRVPHAPGPAAPEHSTGHTPGPAIAPGALEAPGAPARPAAQGTPASPDALVTPNTLNPPDAPEAAIPPAADPADPAGSHAHGSTDSTGSTGPSGSTAPGGHGLDPSTVCLAVLGVWGAALLGAVRAWWRRRAGHGPARAHGLRPGPGPRPRPPPPRTRLTRLSVLRI